MSEAVPAMRLRYHALYSVILVIFIYLNGTEALKIAVIGSGNWGSVVARNLARNVQLIPAAEKKVKMWVHDESLVKKINIDHMNEKYLPGVSLTENVVATSNLEECGNDADVLVFVMPHEYLPDVVKDLKGKIKPSAIGVSLAKSITMTGDGPQRCSEFIKSELNLEHVAVVMGANIASDIAADAYAETTVACSDLTVAHQVARLFESAMLTTEVSEDVSTVEFCGALKNIVALGAGLCDGLGGTSSSKAALMRQGFKEMTQFCREFDQTGKFTLDTMMLSCGVADLIATSANGRNYKIGATFVPLLATAHRLRYDSNNVGDNDDNIDKSTDRNCDNADARVVEDKNLIISSQIRASVMHSDMDALPTAIASVNDTVGIKCNTNTDLSTLTTTEWKAYVHTLWNTVDNIVCNGQKPQGVWTCEQVVECIHRRYQNDPEVVFKLYPLFSRIYEVVVNGDLPTKLFVWK